jgi:hypothetical protein
MSDELRHPHGVVRITCVHCGFEGGYYEVREHKCSQAAPAEPIRQSESGGNVAGEPADDLAPLEEADREVTPRKWTLHFWDETGEGDMQCDVDPMSVDDTGDTFKVVKKSAYDRERARADKYQWEYENLCKFATQFERERDSLRAQLEAARAGRDTLDDANVGLNYKLKDAEELIDMLKREADLARTDHFKERARAEKAEAEEKKMMAALHLSSQNLAQAEARVKELEEIVSEQKSNIEINWAKWNFQRAEEHAELLERQLAVMREGLDKMDFFACQACENNRHTRARVFARVEHIAACDRLKARGEGEK